MSRFIKFKFLKDWDWISKDMVMSAKDIKKEGDKLLKADGKGSVGSLQLIEGECKKLCYKGICERVEDEPKPEETPIQEKILAISKAKFSDENLLIHILAELNKSHIMDEAVKMTTFLVGCTAYLDPPELRKSIAAKGTSSAGKDNMFKACLKQFPPEDIIFLTHATVATMQDDITNYRIIAYSEVNLQRDDKGANSHLVEVIKQLSEGGTSSLKKDLETGYKTTRHIKQEQKSVLYGTTETVDDDELSTRFIIGAVEAPQRKIQAVNNNTLRWFAGEETTREDNISWVQGGIKELLKSYEVVLPYCTKLPSHMFDSQDPRSMRDVKRLLACASAIAWLHQLQREKDGNGRIVSEPFDLLAAIIITGDFFNHTYQGLGDQRLQKCLDTINEVLDSKLPDNSNVFNRREIQERMGVSLNTIKGYLKGLNNLSIAVFDHKEGNEIYYKRYQKGVNRVLIGVSWRELLVYFQGCQGVKIPQSTVSILKKLDSLINKPETDHKEDKEYSTAEKIDTLKLTPSHPLTQQIDQNVSRNEWGVWDLSAIVHLSCVQCGAKECNLGPDGKPYCYNCGQWQGSTHEVIGTNGQL